MLTLHAAYVRQEAELRAALPPDLRAAWDRARAGTEAELPPRDAPQGWVPRPLGLIAPATACLLLNRTLAMMAAARALRPPVTNFPDLLRPEIGEAILNGPLLDHAGATRSMILFGTATFAWRCLRIPARHVFLAAKRVAKAEPRRDRSNWARPFDEYWNAARKLDPLMEPGEPHDVDTAVWSRRAATSIVAVEVAPRRGELAGLQCNDVIVEEQSATIVISAALSKTGVSQVRTLTDEGSAVFLEYFLRARPFLASLGSQTAAESALWLADDGNPLGLSGVITTLQIHLAGKLGAKVCCNRLRSATADDADEREAGDLIGHVDGSSMANDVYATKDYRAAVADLGGIWAAYD